MAAFSFHVKYWNGNMWVIFVVVEKWNIEAEINNSFWFEMLRRNWNVKYWNLQYWNRNNFFLVLNNASVWCYIIIKKWNIDAEITFSWFQMLRRCYIVIKMCNIETEIILFVISKVASLLKYWNGNSTFFWFQKLRRCGGVKLSCFNLNSLSERAAQRKPRIFATSFSIFS